jgi:fumarylpyruvate hydrolase
MLYVIQKPPRPALPVVGTDDLFPVRRVYCVGRNYAAHAREMGHDPNREPPFFFMKPADALLPASAGETVELPYPPKTADYHFEVEMVAALGQGGRDIPVEAALDCVYGYAVGLDMTRRDIQAEAKKLSRPWAMAKSFDQSCPISAIVPASRIGHPQHGRIEVAVNGTVQQTGDLGQMIWSVPETIAFLSRYVALAPGDLIMTGTPAGVSRVRPGDVVHGRCEGVGEITVAYKAASPSS